MVDPVKHTEIQITFDAESWRYEYPHSVLHSTITQSNSFLVLKAIPVLVPAIRYPISIPKI